MKKLNFGLVYLVLCHFSLACEAQPTLPLVVNSVRFSSPTTKISAAESKVLTELEDKYYQRNFEADLPEKRLTRLELFLRGTHSKGAISERIANLKELSATNAKAINSGGVKPTRHNLAQSVTQLELSIQKSTNPNLKLEMRLANLEKKVFGRVFSGISLEQRIDRLQKTIALTDEGIASASPRLEQEDEMMPPGLLFRSPFAPPYGSQNDLPMPPEMNRSMAEMFNQLNRDLRQLHKLPPGVHDIAPYNFPGSGGNLDSGSLDREFSDGLPDWPKDSGRSVKPSLPPYMDPNSI